MREIIVSKNEAGQRFDKFLLKYLNKAGSGFIVVIAGDMMLMPGLSKVPNAEKIDMLSDGTIIGLS